MMLKCKNLKACFTGIIALLVLAGCVTTSEGQRRVAEVKRRIGPELELSVKREGRQMGDPVFVRIFKDPGELEVWMADESRVYTLFKNYPICNFSGNLGPKVKEGDMQAPEGFYSVDAQRLHPESQFHLAFNIGYPNAYDAAKGRTGNFVMVHGDCRSKGCYAMTDRGIEEIYLLAEAALRTGQREVPVHIFPFRMDDANMAAHSGAWTEFWGNLQTGYQYFELAHVPPEVSVQNGRYVFFANTPGDRACLNCLSL
ncbi:MAG: L,D-transpeptidase family protein [Alphaproteobacteria bacterium]